MIPSLAACLVGSRRLSWTLIPPSASVNRKETMLPLAARILTSRMKRRLSRMKAVSPGLYRPANGGDLPHDAHLLDQIAEAFIMLRLRDRAAGQKCVQRCLLAEEKDPVLFHVIERRPRCVFFVDVPLCHNRSRHFVSPLSIRLHAPTLYRGETGKTDFEAALLTFSEKSRTQTGHLMHSVRISCPQRQKPLPWGIAA